MAISTFSRLLFVSSGYIPSSSLEPFSTAVPFWGANYSEFEWFRPPNGTAALKG